MHTDSLHVKFPEADGNFQPLSLTRSVLDFKAGIFTIREKWIRLAASQHHLISFDDEKESVHEIKYDTFWIPSISTKLDQLQTLEPEVNGCSKIDRPWDILPILCHSLTEDISILGKEIPTRNIPASVHVNGDHEIHLHENCKLEPCMINTDDGPVLIDDGAAIMQGAMLRGPVYIGKNATVKMGAMLYAGCSIGENCVIGGEVKNTIFHANANKAHHGYIGDSYIGEFCNLGAGSSCSNLKNTAGKIKVWNMHMSQFEGAANKLGIIMGDHVRTAINTAFNSGSVIGPFSNIFNLNGLSPKYIPPFSWGGSSDEKYKLEYIIKDTQRWQEMKGVVVSQSTVDLIKHIYLKF
ncbi:MAG: hypothetical protein ACK4YD_08250 [Chitinophagia bacterium]|jgi:UDP-N-acetylglucosamine diphosphorylase/glucosamine-1-phosphate N-acetyltransferase